MKKHTPWNRECSALRSRGGIIIHSALQRSTGFLSPGFNRASYESAEYWALGRSGRARDAWIEAAVLELPLDEVEARALRARFPRWSIRFSPPAGQSAHAGSRSADWTASRPDGRLNFSVGAGSARELADRILAARRRNTNPTTTTP